MMVISDSLGVGRLFLTCFLSSSLCTIATQIIFQVCSYMSRRYISANVRKVVWNYSPLGNEILFLSSPFMQVWRDLRPIDP